MKKLWFMILVLGSFFTACKEGSEDPNPSPSFTTGLKGNIKGSDIAAAASGLVSTYYADQGESTGALEVAATLSGGEKLTFFIEEAKAGTITLSQTFPAVMEGNSQGLRLKPSEPAESSLRTLVTPVSYVKYLQSNTSYFAVSGTLVIKIDGNNLTVEWTLTFKDAEGKTFSSSGGFTLKDFKSNQKPRAEISNPTSNLSITNITPDYGKAGTEVIIKGTGFSALKSENKITLGGLSLDPTAASATELKITIPEEGEHAKIKVEVLGGIAESGIFYYEPIFKSASKLEAKIGDQVTLGGKHFDPDKSKLEVKIGDKAMEIVSSTLTEILFKIPEGTTSGKLTVARKGKTAIEGPEMMILSEPVLQGPPIGEVFEKVSGNLEFQEVLMNLSSYGPFWSFEIDKANHKLYAVGQKGIVEVNLATKATSLLADLSSSVYKSDLGVQNVATIPTALYPTGDGYLYGIRNPIAASFSTNNVFKMKLSDKSVTMLGSTKVNSATFFAGLYVSPTKRIYVSEYTTGFFFSSYDENMGDRKVVVETTSGAASSELVPMGGNDMRLLRKNSQQQLSYYQINNGVSVGESSWVSQSETMRPVNGSTTDMVGIDYLNGNFYGFFLDLDDTGHNYVIGVQPNGTGNFQKKGEFKIKQTYTRSGDTRYLLSMYGNYNIVGVDKEGAMYFLMQTPIDSQGNPVDGPLGGIYKVSF